MQINVRLILTENKWNNDSQLIIDMRMISYGQRQNVINPNHSNYFANV